MIESRTPKYLNDCKTAYELNNFGDFLEFGLMHLTKWQSQEYNSSMRVFIELRNLLPKNFLAAFLPPFCAFYVFYFDSYPIQIFKTGYDLVFSKILRSCWGN